MQAKQHIETLILPFLFLWPHTWYSSRKSAPRITSFNCSEISISSFPWWGACPLRGKHKSNISLYLVLIWMILLKKTTVYEISTTKSREWSNTVLENISNSNLNMVRQYTVYKWITLTEDGWQFAYRKQIPTSIIEDTLSKSWKTTRVCLRGFIWWVLPSTKKTNNFEHPLENWELSINT